MIASFFDVEVRIIERYISKYAEKLEANGYTVLKGKKLKEFLEIYEDTFATDINVGHEIRALSVFDFRAFLNMGMLAMTLMAKPKLIILDEPMNGLDPDGVIELRKILRDLRDEGSSILISSHQLTEMEKVTDRVLLFEQGSIVLEIDDLKEIQSKNQYSITLEKSEKMNEIIDKYNLEYKENSDTTFNIFRGDLNNVIKDLIESNIEIKDIVKICCRLKRCFMILLERFKCHSLSFTVPDYSVSRISIFP